MLDVSALAAICAGPDNLIVSWNDAATELFGHHPRDAIGKPLSIIIPERHRAAHHAGLARAVRTGTARLSGHTTEILALHADGHEMPVDLSLSMWFEGDKPMFGALIRDITDRQAARTRLEHLAHCDTLTALPNRNALHWHLAALVDKGPCALLLLDLDAFKHVNDTLGHSAGDQLIADVAKKADRSCWPVIARRSAGRRRVRHRRRQWRQPRASRYPSQADLQEPRRTVRGSRAVSLRNHQRRRRFFPARCNQRRPASRRPTSPSTVPRTRAGESGCSLSGRCRTGRSGACD